MLSEGLVAWSADRKDLLTVTALGSRLAAASFTKPIPRAKADRLVADLLQRAKEINSRTDLLLWVDEIRCFGSYITDSPDVGDIDLVVSLRRRIEDGTEFVKRTLERAEQSGKRFSNYAVMLSYSDHEVLLLLKNRVSYLSFHPMSDLETLKFETRIVFQRKPALVV